MYFPFAIKIGPKTWCGHCGFILDRFSEVEVWFHFGSLFPRLRSIYKQGPGGWSIGAGSFLYLGTGAPEAYPGRILVNLGGFLSHPDDLLFFLNLLHRFWIAPKVHKTV